MITTKNCVSILSISILVLSGCANSSKIYRYNDNTNYSSLFVNRDSGAKVFILMENGKEYSGELLRVRNSSLILCEKYGANEDELSEFDYTLYSIKNQNIKIIELKGENHLIAGLVFGGLIGITLGIFVGVAIDYTPFDKPTANAASIFLVAGGTGMLIGGIIGGNNTTFDEVIYKYTNSDEYDFTQLNIYARYGGDEPEYLRKTK